MIKAKNNGHFVGREIQHNFGEVAVRQFAPRTDWREMCETEHFVQFYEGDNFLLTSLGGFIGVGLAAGDSCIVVATKAHRDGLEKQLQADGFNMVVARASGQYVSLDAAETLSKFVVDGSPEPGLFVAVVEEIIARAAQGKRRVRIFGEMVALLWADGNQQAAIRLEEFWNKLHETHPFLLFCAYPMNGVGGEALVEPFSQVCTAHSRVIPAESYTALTDPDDRLRAIIQLQQQAKSLQAEITERKEAEEKLIQANRRKDEFLAMLAHELRNPLSPILCAIQLLRQIGPAEPRLEQARDVIERQAQHLTQLVDDLLDASRITLGKIRLRKEKLELMSVIGRALETSRPLIESRNHSLSFSLPQEPLRLEGDMTRLAQVVSNLLNNAAKYTGRGGHIWLTAEREGAEIVLRVRDNGPGIPATLLPHIFDLFTQAERSLARSEGGLGVGLALVRSLVEMHGGHVEAFSAGPGQGSEFIVRLPMLPMLAEAARETSLAKSVAAGSAPKTLRRILVVDDNVDSAECMALLLRQSGHEVQLAHDGLTAIEAAQTFHPQVVLLDIGLPELDGYEVARRLREHPEMGKAILIAITGYGRAEDHRLSKQAGFDHHLVKPVDPDAVEALVDSLVLD